MCSIKGAPLVYDHGWQIEPEGFRRAMTRGDAGDRAGPSEQSDRPLHEARGRRRNWRRLCRERGLALIVDEVFLDYGFGDGAAGEFCGRARRRGRFRGERA